MNKRNSNFINRSRQAAGRYLLGTVGALVCVCLVGCSGADHAMTMSLGEPLEQSSSAELVQEAEANDLEETVLYVYVCGAVVNPGVVILPAGSRCNDALEAAGGFREDAAREAVNLAELVTDGMQLYFPTGQELEEQAAAWHDAEDGLININTAEPELLCTLPGIGEAKANAIVAYRKEHGAFGAPEDIMQVPGIKESAYSQMRDFIKVK